ncbi:hypothetical protein JZ751_003123 [Albula glossodonta]|uniref:Uncharacterized protein n=1 Tax=Albula glossodonta TaxID=121402 RepID=A0A8T2N8U1_9TELE|nr:hypothetical protein JZ751_003123 [Albula glossodonta]
MGPALHPMIPTPSLSASLPQYATAHGEGEDSGPALCAMECSAANGILLQLRFRGSASWVFPGSWWEIISYIFSRNELSQVRRRAVSFRSSRDGSSPGDRTKDFECFTGAGSTAAQRGDRRQNIRLGLRITFVYQ